MYVSYRILPCKGGQLTDGMQNSFAPVAAGYVGVSQGWRWVYWWTAIFTGGILVLMSFFLEETRYIPLIEGVSVRNENTVELQDTPLGDDIKLDTKVEPATESQLERTETNKTQRRRLVPIDHSIPMNSYRHRHRLISTKTDHSHNIARHYWQPIVILFRFPAIAFTAFQYGVAIASLSIVATTQSMLYVQPPYLFTSVGIGNMNIPPATGSIIGAFYGGFVVDKFILWAAKKRGGVYDPEMRLWLYFLPGLMLSFGILLYGLTIAKVSGSSSLIPCETILTALNRACRGSVMPWALPLSVSAWAVWAISHSHTRKTHTRM